MESLVWKNGERKSFSDTDRVLIFPGDQGKRPLHLEPNPVTQVRKNGSSRTEIARIRSRITVTDRKIDVEKCWSKEVFVKRALEHSLAEKVQGFEL